MRGIVSAAGYVPYRRLTRAQIGAFLGAGGGKGTRAVASHDEDTTTMGVEAARLALRSAPASRTDRPVVRHRRPRPTSTRPTPPPSTVPCACRPTCRAFDFGGALRSGVGALTSALSGNGTVLVVAADRRDGLPTSGRRVGRGRRRLPPWWWPTTAAASPVVAEFLGGASATDEFVDRWRAPGEQRAKLWEERFGETRYLDLGRDAWARALKNAGVSVEDVARWA